MGKSVERGNRVIAFDQRGHGRSTLGSDGSGSAAMAGDYHAVLEHFDVRDGVLVGHSMGGFVAIRAVLDHPDMTQRLRGLSSCSRRGQDAFKTARRRTGYRCRCCKAACCNGSLGPRPAEHYSPLPSAGHGSVTRDDLGVPRKSSPGSTIGP